MDGRKPIGELSRPVYILQREVDKCVPHNHHLGRVVAGVLIVLIIEIVRSSLPHSTEWGDAVRNTGAEILNALGIAPILKTIAERFGLDL